MNMELRFYRGRGFLAWLVRFFTHSKFAHVEIVIDGIAFVCRPGMRCGSRWAPEPDGQAHVSVVCDPGFYGRVLEGLGTRYDLWGALRSGTPFGREHPDRWFCSELAAHVIGLDKPHTWSPKDLAKYYSLDKLDH